MEYIRLCKNLTDTGRLIPSDDDIYNYVNKDVDSDWYKSLFHYNEEHFKQFKRTGTIRGITDVRTNLLVWDFDSEENIDLARQDAIELCSRLIAKGIDQDAIDICFSGRKGFAVEVATTDKFTVPEFRNIVSTLAEGLETYDPVVSNASRIIRVPGSKHQKSGLYKRPLTLAELNELPVNTIKEMAKDCSDVEAKEFIQIRLPESVNTLRGPKQKERNKLKERDAIDFSSKPRGFSNCKFAIMNGHFEEGQRNQALTILAATCKANHYPKEVAYNICKAAARLQSVRQGQEQLAKEEIWAIVDKSVYTAKWNGGAFTCKSDPLLKHICEGLGHNKCKEDQDKAFIELLDLSDRFSKFATEIEKNTVKTGIAEVDREIQLTVGMTVGILGAPSSGKTNTLLNILNHSSIANVPCIFFSMDMAAQLVYLKLIQKHTRLSKDEIFRIYKEDPKKVAYFNDLLRENYKNVRFSFKTGTNVETMKHDIMRFQDETGQKVKIVGYDYLECIQGPYSDSNANTALIANQLKDLGNELDVCNLLLLQPQKRAGDPSEPLLSMRDVKGSSVIEQACSTIMTISRPGFSPTTPEYDKFISISTVKDRMSSLVSLDLSWDGLTGTIKGLNADEQLELKELRNIIAARKKAEAADEMSGWG